MSDTAKSQQPPPRAEEWNEAQRICDLPQVDEAIRDLLADQTGDNATCLVREILRASTDSTTLAQITSLLTANGKTPEGPAATIRIVAAHVRMNRELASITHDIMVANQAAWIEWQHGAGAEAGMQWIENGLTGPGMIPGGDDDDIESDDPILKDAQGYFDRHSSWSEGAQLDSKIAAKLRAAKNDTKLLNFVDAQRVTVKGIGVPTPGSDAAGAVFEVSQYSMGDACWRVIGHGSNAREAIREAIRTTDPQADLFAAVSPKGGA